MKRLILLFFLLVTACSGAADTQSGTGGEDASAGGGNTSVGGGKIPVIKITSPAFSHEAAIPDRFTCTGEDISPALEWAEPPPGTQSLALIMDDPDAPMGTWVHWVVYNLPADTRGLPESTSQGKSAQANLPAGAQQGKNSFNRGNYGGPCPPSGEHHYRFYLFALDTTISGESLDKAALLNAMDGHILGRGELVGLYKKP